MANRRPKRCTLSKSEVRIKLMLRIATNMYRFVKNVAGARGVSANATVSHPVSARARTSVLTCRSATRGLMGGFICATGRLKRTGLRVRPPPSLLRGLQAPPGSLSPPGGAAFSESAKFVRAPRWRVVRTRLLRLQMSCTEAAIRACRQGALQVRFGQNKETPHGRRRAPGTRPPTNSSRPPQGPWPAFRANGAIDAAAETFLRGLYEDASPTNWAIFPSRISRRSRTISGSGARARLRRAMHPHPPRRRRRRQPA